MQLLIPEKEINNELRDHPISGEDCELNRKKAAAKLAREMGATGKLKVTRNKSSYLVQNV